jgi:hypothetical protein
MSDYELNQYIKSTNPSLLESRPGTADQSRLDGLEGQSGEHILRHEVPLDHETVATAVDKEGNQDYVTGLKLFSILASVTMAAFLMLLDGSIIGVVSAQYQPCSGVRLNRQAIPRITSEFHSLDDIGWYTAAYQLSSAALQPLSGKIYTHISTKVGGYMLQNCDTRSPLTNYTRSGRTYSSSPCSRSGHSSAVSLGPLRC